MSQSHCLGRLRGGCSYCVLAPGVSGQPARRCWTDTERTEGYTAPAESWRLQPAARRVPGMAVIRVHVPAVACLALTVAALCLLAMLVADRYDLAAFCPRSDQASKVCPNGKLVFQTGQSKGR